jgi:MFS transporter, DHA3 family, macrolide efflux protein
MGSYLHKVSKSILSKFGLFLLGASIILLPYGSKFESRQIIQTFNSYLPHILTINGLHIMVVLAFVLGFAVAFIFVPANTVLQEETSDESRGKTYGVLNSLIGITSIIPVLAVGGLADIFGVKSVITLLGVVVIVLAFIRTFITERE